MRDMPIDITVNVVLILPLTGWLVLSAATNLPFPPGAFGAAESWLWPLAVLMACLFYVAAFARDMLRGGRRHATAAFFPALVLGAFALRVAFGPLDPDLPPSAMTGLPEGLAVFTAIFALYGALALAISRKRAAHA